MKCVRTIPSLGAGKSAINASSRSVGRHLVALHAPRPRCGAPAPAPARCARSRFRLARIRALSPVAVIVVLNTFPPAVLALAAATVRGVGKIDTAIVERAGR